MNDYEIVVIGGGAAGLSAALVLVRARRSVAVIDAGSPRNAPAAAMHGFLSRDGAPPASLLATGLRDELPDVPGVRERWGVDLLHCPYCHGYEVRDQPLGVLGGTPDAVFHALLLPQWSGDVVYFPHTDTLSAEHREQLAARSVVVVEGLVSRLVVEHDRLHGVELADGRVVPRAAVFVRPRMVPNNQLLVALGCRVDDRGWVVADPTGRTSVPGVWVAGNAADARAQVITAAGQGSAAAIAINADLVEEDVGLAVRRHRATPA